MRLGAGPRQSIRANHVQPMRAGGVQVLFVQLEHDDRGLRLVTLRGGARHLVGGLVCRGLGRLDRGTRADDVRIGLHEILRARDAPEHRAEQADHRDRPAHLPSHPAQHRETLATPATRAVTHRDTRAPVRTPVASLA